MSQSSINHRNGYEVTSFGTNREGNYYESRDYSSSFEGKEQANSNTYYYSNKEGGYYYNNPNGSQYYNDGNGYACYKRDKEDEWSLPGNK
ncbi:MAG: hypothetical protein Q9175_004972 [Cornicularia normoerica]